MLSAWGIETTWYPIGKTFPGSGGSISMEHHSMIRDFEICGLGFGVLRFRVAETSVLKS